MAIRLARLLSTKILNLPRIAKRSIVLSVDVVLLPVALWLSFSLRFGQLYVPVGDVAYLFLVVPVIAVPIFVRLGLYRAVIRYIGFLAMWAVVKAVALYTLGVVNQFSRHATPRRGDPCAGALVAYGQP